MQKMMIVSKIPRSEVSGCLDPAFANEVSVMSNAQSACMTDELSKTMFQERCLTSQQINAVGVDNLRKCLTKNERGARTF